MTEAEKEAVSVAVSALEAVYAIVDVFSGLPNGAMKEAGPFGAAMLAKAAAAELSEVIQ